MSFFAGNDKLLLVKKQDDKSTPITDWTDALALRVYEFSKDPVRAQGPLSESDASTQEGASHVTAITPAISFGVYGRPSELDLLAEALLGDNFDDSTGPPFYHIARPDQDQPYYGILEVDPYANTAYNGCRLGAASFTAQDTGETELKVTGLQWQVLGVTHGVSTPSPMPEPVDELPFIYAECTVKYNGTSAGRTSTFTANINRNLQRIQGDAGFTALDIVATKISNDGQVTRYVSDDDTLRAVDTGTVDGTVPTTDIFTESFSFEFSRSSGDLAFKLESQEIAYETREAALALDGAPIAEVLGYRHQPQTDVADNVTITTTNAKATPDTT